jgi:hypothetical protein
VRWLARRAWWKVLDADQRLYALLDCEAPPGSYYVLCDERPAYTDWPTLDFHDAQAVALFSDEAKAVAYRATDQRLARYPVTPVSPDHLKKLLTDCMADGVTWVVHDPSGGHAQGVLILRFLANA